MEIDAPGDACKEVILVPGQSGDGATLRNYGVETRTGSLWQSLTPVALPHVAARRRIDPIRRVQEGKGGPEMLAEEERAIVAVSQALRHANVGGRVDRIRVQREPFDGIGHRAEAFADGTRFTKETLARADPVC